MLGMLVTALIWGSNYTVLKIAVTYITPLAYNAVRFSLAAAFNLVIARSRERDLSMPRAEWKHLVLLSLLGMVLNQMLFIQGAARTRASNAALIQATQPLIMALLLWLLHTGERVRTRTWVGMGASFAGIVLIVGSNGAALAGTNLVGDALVLAGIVIWSLFQVLVRPVLQRNSAVKSMAWILTLAVPWLILFGLPEISAMNWRSVPPQAWGAVIYSSVLATSVAQIMWQTGVERLGIARTAVLHYVIPVVSIVVAWTVLGERMQVRQVLGSMCVLGGVVLARYRPSVPAVTGSHSSR
jgi:drug/metabolite transporter (DMT)-like permease